MPINPGACFDHYEILAPLGKAGMGEVYRALDTRLNREVALKILPNEKSKMELLNHEALNEYQQNISTQILLAVGGGSVAYCAGIWLSLCCDLRRVG